MDEDSIKYSAFVTGEQNLEFLRFFPDKPFGLSGACSTLLRLVSNCLENCREYTAGYFDDILVHSDDWNSHISHILEVGFTFNRKKCQFGRATVDFLGFQVGMDRIEPRQRKVEAILNFPRPNSKKTLSSWVSLASYFQRFLPNFAHIVSVLTDLLRKNVHFHWSENAETALWKSRKKWLAETERKREKQRERQRGRQRERDRERKQKQLL